MKISSRLRYFSIKWAAGRLGSEKTRKRKEARANRLVPRLMRPVALTRSRVYTKSLKSQAEWIDRRSTLKHTRGARTLLRLALLSLTTASSASIIVVTLGTRSKGTYYRVYTPATHTHTHRIISPPVVVQPQLEFSSNGDSRSWRVKRGW